jgi:protein-L-isoaspartate(D-aspartate) O-methyltransferase
MTASPNYAFQRSELVRHLRNRGIADERVLAAMSIVPREAFVPEALRERAYEDHALPIGLEQTISQPFTVAYMCEALQLRGHETVLEIGTGSGYGAAVLSRLVSWVYTIERLPELAEQARRRTRRLGFHNVEVRVGDGSLGWPDAAPFDAIIVTAGAEHCPAAYRDQLAEGGRIVIPVGPVPRRQTLVRYTLRHGELLTESLGDFAFVPLIGADAWEGDAEGDDG